jgi:hypothetical protein
VVVTVASTHVGLLARRSRQDEVGIRTEHIPCRLLNLLNVVRDLLPTLLLEQLLIIWVER